MAVDFQASFDAAKDQSFKERIEACIYKVASMVLGEIGSGTILDKRHDLAHSVIRGGAPADITTDASMDWVRLFSITTASTNATIDENSSDADIEFQVTALWNDFAGVKDGDV